MPLQNLEEVTFSPLLVYLSVMRNYNTTSNFIFCASERELITLSNAEILSGILADYKSFSRGIAAGIRIPEELQGPRMGHACILYAEGIRLAHTHLELAKKLILASLFYHQDRATEWLTIHGEAAALENLSHLIQEFEDFKAAERKRKEEQELRLKGLAK